MNKYEIIKTKSHIAGLNISLLHKNSNTPKRFKSIIDPGKFPSLSFWENEESISLWRNLENHRSALSKGRDYFLWIIESELSK